MTRQSVDTRCFESQRGADGSPRLTQTWVDTDDEHILIYSVQGHLKLKNIRRDPRLAVAISDPQQASRYFQVRGRVMPLGLAVQRHGDELRLVIAPKVTSSVEQHLNHPRSVSLSNAALEAVPGRK